MSEFGYSSAFVAGSNDGSFVAGSNDENTIPQVPAYW